MGSFFITVLSIKNIAKQKSRSWGIGLITGVCALALICVFFYAAVIMEQIANTNQEISSLEQEEKLEGDSDWQAQQAGSLSENISDPLLVALAGMKLLIAFLWIAALVEIAAITSVILPERYRELGMYRLLGCSEKKIIELLVLESCNISFLGSIAGGAIGIFILWGGGIYLVSLTGLAHTSVTVLTLLPQAILAVMASALTGPVVSLVLGIKVSKKEILFLLSRRK